MTYRNQSPIDNYEFKPGLKVKVIDIGDRWSDGRLRDPLNPNRKVGDIGTIT